ncbi:hypothetical protein POVWA2_032980 [Plasmodium ovale wallikeri]|uniref:Uncharacterized protein n=1 Tax=Plasmodium ovale wallikeri TaxID=864142 RepID=A0A1A8YY13_PLAOA|nr:hypothetical protein POVWA1_033360 [Plasmodium ovale wallikeri]SBT37063.1 hypothetical protein POVWA2_032980 [Plasmodium ovale wallikeri]
MGQYNIRNEQRAYYHIRATLFRETYKYLLILFLKLAAISVLLSPYGELRVCDEQPYAQCLTVYVERRNRLNGENSNK